MGTIRTTHKKINFSYNTNYTHGGNVHTTYCDSHTPISELSQYNTDYNTVCRLLPVWSCNIQIWHRAKLSNVSPIH